MAKSNLISARISDRSLHYIDQLIEHHEKTGQRKSPGRKVSQADIIEHALEQCYLKTTTEAKKQTTMLFYETTGTKIEDLKSF